MLGEIDAAESKSARGQILRREGLYSPLVSARRDQRERGALEAMETTNRGPKSDATKNESARLRAKVAELDDRLATAEELIDAQGKASALLQTMRRKSAEPTS